MGWIFLLACSGGKPAIDCAGSLAVGDQTCRVPGSDRDFILHLPPDFDGRTALPLVISLHGGGGHKEGANQSTCANGDEGADNCMSAVADQRGYMVAYPDGTPSRLAQNKRSWNAGGGEGDWQCVSSEACKNSVDDIGYIDDLLQEVRLIVPVDVSRVYAVGISNGGAMSYRLACERAGIFAGIASVGGGNQVGMVQGCSPAAPVRVLEIHGTADPCWPFEGGPQSCLQVDGKNKASVEESLEGTALVPGWSRLNQCSASEDIAIPDSTDDGTLTTQRDWSGCTAPVRLLRVEGGGHTWPRGWDYLGESFIGPVGQDFSGTTAVFDFFETP